jgi:hypothetical protein
MHTRVDRVEPELGFQAEQVQWVFRGPQALSYEDANIIIIKASPSASNHYPWVLFIFISYLWFLDVH